MKNRLIKAAILSLGLLGSCKIVPFGQLGLDYSNIEFDIPQIEYPTKADVFIRELSPLEQILWFVRENTDYISDKLQYGRGDYWATPDKTFNSRLGDCEDHVILDMYLLKRDLGIDSSMITGIDKEYGTAHAWLEVDGKTYDAMSGIEKSFDNYFVYRSYSYSDVMKIILNENKSFEVT